MVKFLITVMLQLASAEPVVQTFAGPGECASAGQCGARGVKFLKLHKVGSSTVATAIEEYALRHPCKYTF
tara:strand:- start:11387 stop:11596 length:210 start_codon:yes stop_codon:yes gene_type:complete